MGLRFFSTFIILCIWASADCHKDINLIAKWKILEFGFHSESDLQNALDNGYVVNNTNPPIDVDVHYTLRGKQKIFVTIPRTYEGTPYSLAMLSDEQGPNGPILYPYPNYEWNEMKSDCSGITSAVRVDIDDCGHMWVMDSGVHGLTEQVCPPQLLTFDLRTDKLIHRYQFSEDVYTPGESILATPLVDIRDPPPVGRCHYAMVYITDSPKSALIVHDSKRKAAWRIENKLMDVDPNFTNHTIDGKSFMVTDGLLALSVTPRRSTDLLRISSRLPLPDLRYNERYLFFHALAAETENKVALRYIDNQKIWKNNKNAMPEAFIELGKRGTQASVEAMDSKGFIYNSIYEPLSIVAWNSSKREYDPSDFQIVADNPEQVQLVTGIKVVKNHLGLEELWAFSSKYQNVRTGTIDPNEDNYMILSCNTDDMLSGIECRT